MNWARLKVRSPMATAFLNLDSLTCLVSAKHRLRHHKSTNIAVLALLMVVKALTHIIINLSQWDLKTTEVWNQTRKEWLIREVHTTSSSLRRSAPNKDRCLSQAMMILHTTNSLWAAIPLPIKVENNEWMEIRCSIKKGVLSLTLSFDMLYTMSPSRSLAK